MSKKAVLVTNYYTDLDDWEGLYIDGKLVQEGHVIQKDELLRHFGITLDTVEVAPDWLEDRGGFPEKLSDVEELE